MTVGGRQRGWALAAACVVLAPRLIAAQEPVFVTPPVTLFQEGGLVGVDVERQSGTLTVSSDAAVGLLSPWTLALHAIGIAGDGTPAQLARLQLGTRLRIVNADRPREWILLSVYGAGAIPLGDAADRIAQAYGVASAVVGLSAARMARPGDVFADVAFLRIPTSAGTRTGGLAGLAIGWRPAPQPYGQPEVQLFGELRGSYTEGGRATVGVAPGVLLHTRRTLLKLGFLIPAWTRATTRDATLHVGAKLLW